jgi:hypothetical protein
MLFSGEMYSLLTINKVVYDMTREGTNIWREEFLIKRFRNIDTEIGIRSIVGCKNKG